MKKHIISLMVTAAALLVVCGTACADVAKLTASDGVAGDDFGYTVSISGDTAIVGAIYDDDMGNTSGAAYIYRWNGTAWTEEKKLTASDGAAEDYFGCSVSVSGDVAIVGAYLDDDRGTNSGSAYIYRRSGATWVLEQKLTASDGAASDYFGCAVSVSGDVAIIGANGDDTQKGAAYIYRWNGAAWGDEKKLTILDGDVYDEFGWSVSVDGDTAIVGAYCYNNCKGSAYIYKWNNTAWVEEQKLTASDGATEDQFGWSVSVSGDVAIVGVIGDNIFKGSAYIYRWNGTAWVAEPKLTASDGAAEDYFGCSVSVSGDVAIVGAYLDDDQGTNAGAAYVYQ